MAVSLIHWVQALVYNVLAISIIQSLEKNPLREGLSMSCRLQIVSEVEMKSKALNKLPIWKVSCLQLWRVDPEYTNNMDFLNAGVQTWRHAKWGWLVPIVTIPRPKCLEVEKRAICCMRIVGVGSNTWTDVSVLDSFIIFCHWLKQSNKTKKFKHLFYFLIWLLCIKLYP